MIRYPMPRKREIIEARANRGKAVLSPQAAHSSLGHHDSMPG